MTIFLSIPYEPQELIIYNILGIIIYTGVCSSCWNFVNVLTSKLWQWSVLEVMTNIHFKLMLKFSIWRYFLLPELASKSFDVNTLTKKSATWAHMRCLWGLRLLFPLKTMYYFFPTNQMCAEDLDCQQGHFFCDGENKCQYEQPRDIPCNNETGCGNPEKYTCGEHNTCVLRTDIHVNVVSFPYFQFKVRLIRLDFFKKQKTKKILAVFELTTYWSAVRSANHYTKVSTVSEKHRKTFTILQSCLTGSSLILLNRRI